MGSCVPLSLNLVENKVLIPNGCKCHGTEVSIGSYLREILACSILNFVLIVLSSEDFIIIICYCLQISDHGKGATVAQCHCCFLQSV